MKEWIITVLIMFIISTIGYDLAKDAIEKRDKYHNEIAEKFETLKNEVKSSGEKLDKLLELLKNDK